MNTGRMSLCFRISIGAVSLALVGSTACGGSAEAEEETQTLTLGMNSEPQSLDPALQESGGDMRWQWHAVYDTLLHCDSDGTVIPNAAESYELNNDATEITMRLREGMTFSDGTPVDSHAAKATIEHMRDSGGSDSGRVAGVEVETPDDLTVVVKAPQPTGQLPTFMCMAPGAIAHPDQLESGEVASAPISSGPYEFDAAGSTSGSVYRFELREDHWNAESYAHEVLELVMMPEATARLNALMSGEVDGAIVEMEQAEEAEDAGFHVISTPGAWAGLYLNDRDGEVAPALGDVRVRQAINKVFDREAIAENSFGGHADPSTQIFNPEATAYVPELDERYQYDVDEARRLMAEAGYEEGFDVEIPSQGTVGDVLNPLIIQQLGLLNIDVVEVPLVGPTALDDILGGRFPIMYARMGTADSLFDIVEALEPGSIWNVMETEDAELQPLLDGAQMAQGEEADEIYREINEYVVEEAWFAPWVADSSFFAVSDEDLLPEMTDAFNANPYLRDFE